MQKVEDNELKKVSGGFNYVKTYGLWDYQLFTHELELINRHKRTKYGGELKYYGDFISYRNSFFILIEEKPGSDMGVDEEGWYQILWSDHRGFKPEEVTQMLADLAETESRKKTSSCTIL